MLFCKQWLYGTRLFQFRQVVTITFIGLKLRAHSWAPVIITEWTFVVCPFLFAPTHPLPFILLPPPPSPLYSAVGLLSICFVKWAHKTFIWRIRGCQGEQEDMVLIMHWTIWENKWCQLDFICLSKARTVGIVTVLIYKARQRMSEFHYFCQRLEVLEFGYSIRPWKSMKMATL